MDSSKTGSAQDLLHTLTSCLNNPNANSARVLQSLLTPQFQTLANPLQKSAKSSTDRQKISKKELELKGGAKRTFGDDFLQKALVLSDCLELNEITCVELLWKAESSKIRYGNSSLIEVAEMIYFEGRKQSLETLLLLFVARQSSSSAGNDSGTLIFQFTTELLEQDLLDVLMDNIITLLDWEDKEDSFKSNQSSSTLSSDQYDLASHFDHRRRERHLLAEIIFTICYQLVPTHQQVTKLLKVLQTVGLRYESSIHHESTYLLHGIFHTYFVLLASILIVLDVCKEHDQVDARGDRTGPRLMMETVFINQFTSILTSPWDVGDAKTKTGQSATNPVPPGTPSKAPGTLAVPPGTPSSKSPAPSSSTSQPTSSTTQAILRVAWAAFLRQTIRFRKSNPIYPHVDILRDEFIDRLLDNLSPAFRAVTFIVEHELLRNDKTHKILYLEAFDELVRGFLTTSSGKARDMKSDEENGLRAEAAYNQYRVGIRPPPAPREFDHFLRLIAALYKGQSELASRYWQPSGPYSNLHHFIRSTGDNLYESNFVAYLHMLSSLASGPSCAEATYTFLLEKSRKYTNWDHFFDVLHKYFMDFQKPAFEDSGYYDYSGRHTPQAFVVRQIRPEEANALNAILELMQSVTRYSLLVRVDMINNTAWRPLDALFQLMTCPVSVSLKAQLVKVVCQFAKDAALQSDIWRYLEAAKIIPTSRTSGIEISIQGPTGGSHDGRGGQTSGHVTGGGLVFELNEVESKEEHYPYTLAFVNLLNTLLTNHYHKSRDTLADVNLWPYVTFVMKDVFQRFDQRSYKNHEEKWKIAKSALRFFLSILRDTVDAFLFEGHVDPITLRSDIQSSSSGENGHSKVGASTKGDRDSSQSSNQVPSKYGTTTLRLFRFFLSRTDLLHKVVEIVCTRGQLESLYKFRNAGRNKYIEDCIRYALMIIETVLLRQEYILQYSTFTFGDEIQSGFSSLNPPTKISPANPNLAAGTMTAAAIAATNQNLGNLNPAGAAGGNPMINDPSKSSSTSSSIRRLKIGDEPPLLSPLHTILLRKLEDVASIALYVTYPLNTTIARLSVSIIHLISRDTDKMALILHDQNVASLFVNGYIDRLESEDAPSHNTDQVFYKGDRRTGIVDTIGIAFPDVDSDEDDSNYWAASAPSVRESILYLLTECATQPEYNLTQLLLGMNPSDSSGLGHHSTYSFNRHRYGRGLTEKPIGGIEGSSISVLPTILNLLKDTYLSYTHPKLCTLSYQLIFTLLKRPREFGGVGRSLRSQEFFVWQLINMNLSLNESTIDSQYVSPEEHASILQRQEYESIAEIQHAQIQHQQQIFGPLLEQRGWLLKSIALELHTCRGTNRTYATKLLDTLFTTLLSGHPGANGEGTLTDRWQQQQQSMMATGNGHLHIQQQRMKMRELLDALEIPLIDPRPLIQGCVYYCHPSTDSASAQPVDLTRCTYLDDFGFSHVDLRLLYSQLSTGQSRIESDFSLADHQSEEMVSEQIVLMRRAVAWNRFQQILKAQYHVIEGWREVLEISLMECYHLLDENSKEVALYEILETLLTRLNSSELRLQLGYPLTCCVLLLTAKLRQLTFPVHLSKLKSIDSTIDPSLLTTGDQGSSSTGRELDIGLIRKGGSNVSAGSSSSSGATSSGHDHHTSTNKRIASTSGQGSSNRDAAMISASDNLTQSLLASASPSYIPIDQLLANMKGICSCILRQGTTLDMRGNLYGALLNFLQFTQRSTAQIILLASSESYPDIWAMDDDHPTVILPQQQQQQRQLYLGIMKQLQISGERMMDIITSDASDAPHLFRSIAFALMDSLLSYGHIAQSGIMGVLSSSASTLAAAASSSSSTSLSSSSLPSIHIKWTQHMSRRGLLRYLIESLIQDDDPALYDLLLPTADSLNDLYVFESKMSMLLSMASSPTGSMILVEAGLLQILSKFQCIDHPHQSYQTNVSAASDTSNMMTGIVRSASPSWLVPVHERYERILIPILRLIASILHQLPRNADVASQIIEWMESHSELIAVTLKDRSPQPTLASVKTLVHLTSIFYHMVPHESLVMARLQIPHSKHQKYLVALWAKYAEHSAVQRTNSLIHPTKSLTDFEDQMMRTELLNLIRNISATFRRQCLGISSTSPFSSTTGNISPLSNVSSGILNDASSPISGGRISPGPNAMIPNALKGLQGPTKIFFGPVIASVSVNAPRIAITSVNTKRGGDRAPLTVLVLQLESCLNHLAALRDESTTTSKKIQGINQCKNEELISIVKGGSDGLSLLGLLDSDTNSLERTTTTQLQQAAHHVLGSRVAEQRSRTSAIYQIIENALVVLWRHLSFYLEDTNQTDEEESFTKTTAALMVMPPKTKKYDKSALQKEAQVAMGGLCNRLEMLPKLSPHQTHVIPTLTRRIKDTLKDAY